MTKSGALCRRSRFGEGLSSNESKRQFVGRKTIPDQEGSAFRLPFNKIIMETYTIIFPREIKNRAKS